MLFLGIFSSGRKNWFRTFENHQALVMFRSLSPCVELGPGSHQRFSSLKAGYHNLGLVVSSRRLGARPGSFSLRRYSPL